MSARRERLQERLESLGAQAMVCARRPNQLYLLDHPDPSTVISRANCAFVLFAGAQTTVFPGVWISNACRDLLTGCEVVPNELGDPAPQAQLAARLRQLKLKKVVFDQLETGLAELLASQAPTTEAVADDVVTVLRRTKDARDLAGLREAARVADLGMQAAFRAVRPGVTCGEVAAEGTAVILRAGAESASMAPAAGPGAQYLDSAEDPRRVIRAGDMVFIDLGIWVHGYLGDMTRSAIVGEGTEAQRDLLAVVQAAYGLASQAMVPGADTAAIYRSVVEHFARKGWDRYFVHHVSHGLGLGGDLPRCARGVSDTLEVGDALSCEPGCYVPRLGGARVENMIYVGKGGPEELTRTPMDPQLGC
ncbi:MAG: Xaa-Pro peptidase family protein [Gemmatimonadota bacterium]